MTASGGHRPGPDWLRRLGGRALDRVADGLAPRLAARLAPGALAEPAAPAPVPVAPPAPPAGAIVLDYPVTPRPRQGYGQPPHPRLAARFAEGHDRYTGVLDVIATHHDALVAIGPEAGPDPAQPHWRNGWLTPLDAALLYGLVATERPSLYVEVGSGNSTKFVRRAIRDHGLDTRIVSIDPYPRAEVDAICDEVVRAPLEDADLAVFDRLGPGDVLFIDNSHRCLQNSDATVVFLEVLPELAGGVLCGLHDIFLPDDYPEWWADRWYSEQYALAAWLLGGGAGAEIVFPAWYVARYTDLVETRLAALWAALDAPERYGHAFFVRTGPRA